MGARSGSISYTLYHVEGELPDDFRAGFLERIREFAFEELTPESEDDLTHGWCALGDLLDVEFTRDKVYLGQYLVLSLRLDRWSLPTALLKARLDRKTRAFLEERGKDKPSRVERDALREEVRRELKRKMLPSVSVVDMVWHVDDGVVRFWTHAKTKNELFVELFESTFGMRLVPVSPYTAAVSAGLSPALVGKLDDVEHSDFGAPAVASSFDS